MGFAALNPSYEGDGFRYRSTHPTRVMGFAALNPSYGRTAGVSTCMPRARHIRNSSRSTYSGAPRG